MLIIEIKKIADLGYIYYSFSNQKRDKCVICGNLTSSYVRESERFFNGEEKKEVPLCHDRCCYDEYIASLQLKIHALELSIIAS